MGAVTPVVALEVVPEVLDRIEFLAVRRQLDECDVVRFDQRAAGVEASPVPDYHGVLVVRDRCREQFKEGVHDLRIQLRAEQPLGVAPSRGRPLGVPTGTDTPSGEPPWDESPALPKHWWLSLVGQTVNRPER